MNDFLEDVASRGQARRHAHPVGIGRAPLLQKTKEDKFCLEIIGKDVSRNVEKRGASGVTFESDVDVSGSLVLAVLLDVGSSGSCMQQAMKQQSCLLAAAPAQDVGDKKKKKNM